ncbi:MAG: DUF4340 domain-containing protein [Deltaproteobacteria bacterium]|nr:DUF4340 domain-containing protein [Deltaproteobacteria bacterium]MBW2138765.1 DUF4340 domain-containing protein [Deltaproteobacteria bacterium]
MKHKKEYLVLALVIIALSAYLFLRHEDRSGYSLPKLPPLPKAAIDRIEIAKGGRTLTLQRKDDRWVLPPEGYRADPEKVRQILDTLEGLALTALVSERRSYERYGLDEQGRIRVKAWAGDQLSRELEIGRVAPSFQHTFVKMGTMEGVYHAQGNFRGSFDLNLDEIRDKKVLAFSESEITQIEIKEKDRAVILSRQQPPVEVKTSGGGEGKKGEETRQRPAWKSKDGKEVKEERLKDLLFVLSRLKCSRYLYGRKKEEFTEPIYRLHLKGAKDYVFSIYSPEGVEGKEYPSTSSESDSPFYLSEGQAKRIMVPLKEILVKEKSHS